MTGALVVSGNLTIHRESALPENRDWTNRFEIHSATSDRVYIVAQHKTKRHWGCSCPGWRRHRVCKHLSAMLLPNYEKPHEVRLQLR